eukprot:snap_masked-scaffold_9-processed-gene-8.37-mRNA-1 protein AED:1.00 eAED:1.00 QI:0/0/0/0/1/1/2/0/71
MMFAILIYEGKVHHHSCLTSQISLKVSMAKIINREKVLFKCTVLGALKRILSKDLDDEDESRNALNVPDYC